jgi:hypothetical protein
VMNSRAESEIVMFVPHLDTRQEDGEEPQSPMKFMNNQRTPVVGMYKQELQGWRSARILNMSREEITFQLDDTQPPTGSIRIVVAGESATFPFRVVCTAKVVRVVQSDILGESVQVSAHIRRWEFIKPKSRNKLQPIR